jgi:N6-adenosine-specific RNA methylase IME4
LLADPPWHYNNRRAIRKDGKAARIGYGAGSFYQTMSAAEIRELQVGRLAADNSALLLWATWPTLPDAMRVISAWGFRFVTCGFLWVKSTLKSGQPWFGVGYYSKSNSEPCLLAVRGRMKPASNSVSQIVYEPHPRDEAGKIIHSRKPAIVREKIVELFGDVPRVELFAREQAPGWAAWGDQIPTEIDIPQQLLLGRISA